MHPPNRHPDPPAPQHCTPFEPQSRRRGSGGGWGWAGMESVIWRPDGYVANLVTPTQPSYMEYSVYCRIGAPKPYYPGGLYWLCLLYTSRRG